MSIRVTVRQLEEQLADLLDHAVESGEECIIERDGEEYAVLVSAREWRRQRPRTDSDAPSSDDLGSSNDQDRRLREVGAKLDALGPEYRLSLEKQSRAEELLAREGKLDPAERRELRALLRECDEIMLRRAEALRRVE